MKKQVWILAALLLILFPARVLAQETTSSVTVQGRGSVTVTPDLGTISFAVTQEGTEAAQVQKAITEQSNKVKDALLETGLPEDQFSTSGIQLYTNYDYSSGEETAVGYRGQISMMIHEISVDEIGTCLQVLSDNGVNQIDGIYVTYSGYEEAYNEALEKAMQQARQKAETIAWAEDARISEQFTVTEGYQDDTLRGMGKTISGNFEMDTFDETAMDTGSGLDYSAGTTQVEAAVTVCYEVTRQ